MSELTTTRIRAAAERLGLTHLPEQVTTLTARAEADQLGYLDFLDLVLGEEVALREQRRFRNALKLSGLPHHKTLDEFDYTFQPGLEPRRIKDLATLQFLTNRANVALLGPPGVGKTHCETPSGSPPDVVGRGRQAQAGRCLTPTVTLAAAACLEDWMCRCSP